MPTTLGPLSHLRSQYPVFVCFITVGPCPVCLDIAILADRSSSVGEFRYRNRVIPFLLRFARSDQWTIGSGDDEYQVSITTFAGNPLDPPSSATVHWDFDATQTDSKSELVTGISKTRFPRCCSSLVVIMLLVHTQTINT